MALRGHDTLGGVSEFHVVPPSVVATIAGPLEAVAPTAVHNPVDGQATEDRLAPGGTVSDVQVVPPSVVPMIDVPMTAVQSEVDGHDTPPQADAVPAHTPPPAANADGTACSCQVDPPSDVPTISAAPELVVPNASQTEGEAHEIATREPVSAGSICCVHVAPPSVVSTATPEP
jgi:hypothetical protein